MDKMQHGGMQPRVVLCHAYTILAAGSPIQLLMAAVVKQIIYDHMDSTGICQAFALFQGLVGVWCLAPPCLIFRFDRLQGVEPGSVCPDGV